LKKILMIFIDGLGLGYDHKENNPFSYTSTPFLNSFLNGGNLTREQAGFHGEIVSLGSLESTLNVPGLPQSATGQAALFTGENAPQKLGYHLNGFPNQPLKELLREKNILTKLKQKQKRVAFLNAYRPEFFNDHLPRKFPYSYSCSTLMTCYAGVKFRTLEDVEDGRAVYMDITNQFLKKTGHQIKTITPDEASRRITNLGRQYHFSLFEYFFTDLVGHQQDQEKAREIISLLDAFIGKIVGGLDLEDTLVLITSDHGNIEEINHSQHTRNRVPLLLAGKRKWRENALQKTESLLDVAPLIIEYLT